MSEIMPSAGRFFSYQQVDCKEIGKFIYPQYVDKYVLCTWKGI